jgi:hypothetical protein
VGVAQGKREFAAWWRDAVHGVALLAQQQGLEESERGELTRVSCDALFITAHACVSPRLRPAMRACHAVHDSRMPLYCWVRRHSHVHANHVVAQY